MKISLRSVVFLTSVLYLSLSRPSFADYTVTIKTDPQTQNSDLVRINKRFYFLGTNPSTNSRTLWEAYFPDTTLGSKDKIRPQTRMINLVTEPNSSVIKVDGSITRIGNTVIHPFAETTETLYFPSIVKNSYGKIMYKLMACQNGSTQAFDAFGPNLFSFSPITGLTSDKATGFLYFFANMTIGPGYQSLYASTGAETFVLAGVTKEEALRGEAAKFQNSKYIYPAGNSVFFSGYSHTSSNPSPNNFSDWKEVLWRYDDGVAAPLKSSIFTGYNQFILPERFGEAFNFNNQLVFIARTQTNTLPQYFIADQSGAVRPLITPGTKVVLNGQSINVSPYGIQKVFAVNGQLYADFLGRIATIDPSTGSFSLYSTSGLPSSNLQWANIEYYNGAYYALAAPKGLSDPLKDASVTLYSMTNGTLTYLPRGTVVSDRAYYKLTHPEDVYASNPLKEKTSFSTTRQSQSLSYTVYDSPVKGGTPK